MGVTGRSSGCCPLWPHAPRAPGPAAGTERRAPGLGLACGPTARDGDRRPPVSRPALAPARAPTVQTRHKPDPGQGLQGPAGSTKPPPPGPLPGLAKSGVTKVAGQGEDRCEVTQGQSSVSPDLRRLLQSWSSGAQVLNFRAGRRARPGSPDLPDHAGLPRTQPRALGCGSLLCRCGLCTPVSVCVHAHVLCRKALEKNSCMTSQQGDSLRKSRTHEAVRSQRHTARVQASQHLLLG